MRLKRMVLLPLAGAVAIILGVLLPGCNGVKDWAGEPYEQKRVERQYQAGASHVAVLAVAPWEEYVESLQPDFQLNSEKALKEVDKVSGRVQHLKLTKFKGGFKLALPTSTITLTDTETTEDGKTSKRSEKVTEEKPGDASKISEGKDPGDFTLTPEALSAASDGLSVDPATRYRSATALFQRVKILNRYLRDVVCREGYRAYLVVLQISLMPRARNMPYDALTLISFFGDDSPDVLFTEANPCKRKTAASGETSESGQEKDQAKKEAEIKKIKLAFSKRKSANKTPLVIPILATDSMEVVLADRGQEFIRGLSLGLSATVQGVGASAGLESLLKNIQSSSTKDLNSLFSVARVSDNTLMVRMGAYRQGPKAYAMVPRTHNVNVLLLVPARYFKTGSNNNNGEEKVGRRSATIKLRSFTNFMDATTGEELKDRDKDNLNDDLKKMAKKYNINEDCLVALLHSSILNNREKFLEFTRETLKNETLRNEASAGKENKKPIYVLDNLKFDVLWMEILKFTCGAKRGMTTFEVPCPAPSATAWLEDDGKDLEATVLPRVICPQQSCADQTIVTLNVRNTQNYSAYLLIRTANRVLQLPARENLESDNSGQRKFLFASLKKLGLVEKDLKGNLTLRLAEPTSGNDPPNYDDYKCYYQVVKAPAKPPTLEISEGNITVRSSGGKGKLGIDLELNSGGHKTAITVEGAQLEVEQPLMDAKIAKRTGNTTLEVLDSGPVIVKLFNLNPKNKVVLTPINARTGKKIGKVKEVPVVESKQGKDGQDRSTPQVSAPSARPAH